MFLHCFPIIPVATEQCDTKRQSLQNFFMSTKRKKGAPKGVLFAVCNFMAYFATFSQ